VAGSSDEQAGGRRVVEGIAVLPITYASERISRQVTTRIGELISVVQAGIPAPPRQWTAASNRGVSAELAAAAGGVLDLLVRAGCGLGDLVQRVVLGASSAAATIKQLGA
jgi:hypothetical protein